jgi:hypothetical protein
MKLLIILLTTTLLSGCFWQTANHSDLQKAAYFCKGIENVQEIEIKANGNEYVICLNGSKSSLNRVHILKEEQQ